MKKNIFQAAVLMTAGFLLSSAILQNELMQELSPLTHDEYNIVERSQPERIKREAETRVAGSHNVIILSGSNGFNKQNTARYLAKKAGVSIYRINLAKLVDQDAEETKKRLSLVFETAKNKDWVLFFDEADALFGKRTPVEDAHDRYDNESTNYFVRLVEKYRSSIIISVTASNNINPLIFEKYIRFSIH